MFENLTTVAVIISALWLGILAYYLYASRQQQDLRQDIDSLRQQLDNTSDTSQE